MSPVIIEIGDLVYFLDDEAVSGQIASGELLRARVTDVLEDTISVQAVDENLSTGGPTIQRNLDSVFTGDQLLDFVFSDRLPDSAIAQTAFKRLLTVHPTEV